MPTPTETAAANISANIERLNALGVGGMAPGGTAQTMVADAAAAGAFANEITGGLMQIAGASGSAGAVGGVIGAIVSCVAIGLSVGSILAKQRKQRLSRNEWIAVNRSNREALKNLYAEGLEAWGVGRDLAINQFELWDLTSIPMLGGFATAQGTNGRIAIGIHQAEVRPMVPGATFWDGAPRMYGFDTVWRRSAPGAEENANSKAAAVSGQLLAIAQSLSPRDRIACLVHVFRACCQAAGPVYASVGWTRPSMDQGGAFRTIFGLPCDAWCAAHPFDLGGVVSVAQPEAVAPFSPNAERVLTLIRNAHEVTGVYERSGAGWRLVAVRQTWSREDRAVAESGMRVEAVTVWRNPELSSASVSAWSPPPPRWEGAAPSQRVGAWSVVVNRGCEMSAADVARFAQALRDGTAWTLDVGDAQGSGGGLLLGLGAAAAAAWWLLK